MCPRPVGSDCNALLQLLIALPDDMARDERRETDRRAGGL